MRLISSVVSLLLLIKDLLLSLEHNLLVSHLLLLKLELLPLSFLV
jgi:hypothetical protein